MVELQEVNTRFLTNTKTESIYQNICFAVNLHCIDLSSLVQVTLLLCHQFDVVFSTWDRVIEVLPQLVAQGVQPAYGTVPLDITDCIPG